MDETAILTNNGFLSNVFQWGAVKSVKLTLYKTHLVIENTKRNEIIDDIQVSDIKNAKSKTSDGSMIIYTNKGKNYHITWQNLDKKKIKYEALLAPLIGPFGSNVANRAAAKQDGPASEHWVDEINKLKG